MFGGARSRSDQFWAAGERRKEGGKRAGKERRGGREEEGGKRKEGRKGEGEVERG